MEALALHALHQRLGARFVELRGRQLVKAYAEPAEEYRAAREGAAVVDLSARELVRVTGSERIDFVHGMVTQDVEKLPEGASAYAAMLTPKGAMVADARVLRRAEDVLLEVEPGYGAPAQQFLAKYLVSEDAELSDATPQLAALTVLGPRAREVWDSLAESNCHELVPLIPGAPSVDLLVPRASLERVFGRLLEAFGRPMGFDALEMVRVEHGVPRHGQDTGEATLPLEAGLERAISYQKGCYIGQEVIARATFRGQVSRKLAGLLLGELAPAPGTGLLAGGKKVGWLTSVVRSPKMGQQVALGYVQRSQLEPGTALELEGGGAATVHSLPF
ncbi:MAG: folate-binding protein YgfZ [Myxococcales bacterium]|nr:folate-binding protein YgfZ [Myxococcales bacterium]